MASAPPELVRWRWEAVGIDYVPVAIEAPGMAGFSYVVGDVTRLPPARGTAAALMDADPISAPFPRRRRLVGIPHYCRRLRVMCE